MVVLYSPRKPNAAKWGRRQGFLNSSDIGGCLDYQSQMTVPTGAYYQTESCEICLCSATERACKQVACAPPKTCNGGYFKRDPKHCCDVCVLVKHSPNEKENLNLKLGVLTVAVFLLFTLILFAMHRMRRKRLLVSLRSFQMLRRSSSANCGEPRAAAFSINGSTVTIESVAGGANVSSDGGMRLDGYSFPDAPPSYSQAMSASPRPPSLPPPDPPLTLTPPPPPYQAEEVEGETLGREDGSVSLSESRESISSYSDSVSSECSLTCSECSCCDSGLSRDSLSSNEVRPRSEMGTVRPAWMEESRENDVPSSSGVCPQIPSVSATPDQEGKAKKSRRKKLKRLFFHKKRCRRNRPESPSETDQQPCGTIV